MNRAYAMVMEGALLASGAAHAVPFALSLERSAVYPGQA